MGAGEPGRDPAEGAGAAPGSGGSEAPEGGEAEGPEAGGEGREAAPEGDEGAGQRSEADEPGTAQEGDGAATGDESHDAAPEGDGAATGGGRRDAAPEGDEGAGQRSEADGPGTAPEGGGAATGDGNDEAAPEGGASQASEAEAELAAQRVERERIARRRAERQGPIDSGGKLSGSAADLLAAVRAVEGGAKPPATVMGDPAPAPRRPAPEPEHRPRPVAAAQQPAVPAGPAPEAVRAVSGVLAEGGAPEALAPQTAALLGEGAEEALRADPWLLLRVAGVRPEQADSFARALLGAECRPDDERRGRAVTVWLLEQAALSGHTALELPRLTEALERLGVPEPGSAVQGTLAEGEALAFQDALEERGEARGRSGQEGGQEDGEEERPVRVLVGLERYALAEESLADGLARLANSVPERGAPAADWEASAGAAQGAGADLIRAVAGHGLVLHTGGEASLAEPAALLGAARALGLRAWAAAPGPLGRDRFAALLAGGAAGAVTVADLLAGTEGPGRDADGALDLDLLVVADAPQLDVETGALLAESLPDGARLVLAGDPAVLWSAGPGRVFADLLAARICPQIASRRPDPGPLGELVSGVGIGELAQVEAPGKEVVIVPVRDAGEAVHRTVQLVAESVPRAFGVPAEETLVITPGHGGAAGTRALNAALKERLNPGPGRFGGFDPGDRVAHSPAPGRVRPGRVTAADADGLHLSCAGAEVVVPRERVEQTVRHGWALTAHQAAGGRWPAVVVVLPGDAAGALSRPWVYTAFGRAARHLSVVQGAEQALPRAVAEVPAAPRTTRLPVLLAPPVAEEG
ncbi:helix-hairpin-helix domain-containing protein [Streptomyces sp. NPDC048182]|uniref:helix-hairpin-helix domain-containing protein n=1 Tax=Streptomyces sp. NPDC048182 TaxID=3365507 RepID=UPI0037121358